MLTEKCIVTADDTRLPVIGASTRFARVDFAAFGIGKGSKVRVDFVNSIAVNATSPNEPTVAQIQTLFALNCTCDTQGTFVLFATIPAIIGH